MNRALLLLCLVSAAARAAPVTVDEAMKDVAELYGKNDSGGALAAIEDARPLVQNKDDDATLAAWQSAIFYSSHRYEDAKLAMRAALELSLEIPPPVRSTQYARDFELMRRSVRQDRALHPEKAGHSPAAVQLAAATRPVKPARRAGAIIGVAGAVFTVAGVVLVIHARRDYNRIESASYDFPLLYSDARDLANAGAVKQGLGIAGLSVGGAALIVAAIMLAVTNEEPPPVAPQVTVGPGVMGIGIAGRLP